MPVCVCVCDPLPGNPGAGGDVREDTPDCWWREERDEVDA